MTGEITPREVIAQAHREAQELRLGYVGTSKHTLAALHAAGYAVVPRDPTKAMKRKGDSALMGWVAPAMHSEDAYRAMIAASEARDAG